MKGLNLFVVASEFWEFGIHNIISFVTNNFSLMKTQYRNQSIDLLCKSIDWFLYDKDLLHEGVKVIIGLKHKKNCLLESHILNAISL